MKPQARKKWRATGCNGKRKHHTAQGAHVHLAKLLKAKKKSDPIVAQMNVYPCPFCKGFHVGSTRGINWDAVYELDRRRAEKHP